MEQTKNLQYPIGQFVCPKSITTQYINNWIQEIEQLPERLQDIVSAFDDKMLVTVYRADGWTGRQVIHHIHDSHHNGYIRFKWAMTEDTPLIKAYYEDRWAELFDTRNAPVQLSLDLIKALHAKWVYFLKGLSETDLDKSFIHPEGNVKITLAEDIGIYAWHGNHHLAHLQIIADKFE